MIEVVPTALEGVLEIRPTKHGDARGFFSETYSVRDWAAKGIETAFVQDNHSFSANAGVLRGLHYQLPPRAQAKVVRVVQGAIFDVAVDIRRGSPTFGRWVGRELSADKWNQLLIPAGFAHGFVTLVPNVEVVYKVSDYYAPDCDRAIRFDDPAIGIDWPVAGEQIQLSDRDRRAPLLADAEVFTFERGA
ncbi:MAG: dTDP-4-dehydrorhamnose 3,5-epimerase [Variibacter sp.]